MCFEYQYTSRCRHPRYPGIDDSALDVDAPSSRWDRASRRHVDYFCPSRPGVTPGPQDHSYTRVWCNTRPLGTLSARVWCNTRPPGPLQPPSGELVIPATPSWEFPGIVPLKLLGLLPGIIPGLEDHLPESSLEFLSSSDALPGEN